MRAFNESIEPKKLTLNKETLRQLTGDELRMAAGGTSSSQRTSILTVAWKTLPGRWTTFLEA